MAAGLTDHVWSLREVLLFRVRPWPHPPPVYSTVPVDECDVERLPCAQMQANRVERGVENDFGALMTG